jgi:hypothetical protein
VRFGNIRGVLRDKGLAEPVAIGSTIAVDLTVEGSSRRVLLIDLYVEDQREHEPGRYVVKIQDIRVGTP